MGCNPCVRLNENELVFKIMSEDKSQSTTNSMHESDSRSSLGSIKSSEATIPFSHQIESLCQINGSIIAVGAINGVISLIDTKKKTKLFSLQGHSGAIKAMKMLKNGQLASASGDGTIKLWIPLAKQFVRNLLGHSGWVNDLLELNDGRLASASSDNTIFIWKKDTYEIDHAIQTEGSKNCLVQIDDDTLAFNSADAITVYDLKNKREQYSFPGAFSTIVAMLYLKEQDILLCGSENGLIRAWDLISHEKIFAVRCPEMCLKTMTQISKDVIAVSSGVNLSLWSISPTTKASFKTLTGHHASVNALIQLSNSTSFVSGADDKSIKIWN